jgi:hypothetical protein
MWTLEGIDLSSWRVAVNAGETVLPETVELFSTRFGPCGFRAESMVPCYGLSENAVALTIPSIDRLPVERDGFLSVGRAVPGHEIRVINARRTPAEEGETGHVQFRGPSRCREYHHNPRLTESVLQEGWMETGDLGFIESGELFITGRSNDAIIREGRMVSPEAVEGAVGKCAGVKAAGVAVVGLRDQERGTEKMVVIAETTAVEQNEFARVDGEIRSVVRELTGELPDDVALIPPGTLPKTSNGKIRRGEARSAYREGRLGGLPGSPWLEMTGLWWHNLGALAGRAVKQVKRSTRSALFGSAARGYAAFTGTSTENAARVLSIIGRRATHSGSHLKGPAVVVANRAARLDPLALVSVIKEEVRLAGDEALCALPDWISGMLTPLVEQRPSELEAVLRRGGIVVVFPDSPIGAAAQRCRIHLRGLEAAIAAGAPVIPVAMQERRGIFVSRAAAPIAVDPSMNARELRRKVKDAIHGIYA